MLRSGDLMEGRLSILMAGWVLLLDSADLKPAFLSWLVKTGSEVSILDSTKVPN